MEGGVISSVRLGLSEEELVGVAVVVVLQLHQQVGQQQQEASFIL